MTLNIANEALISDLQSRSNRIYPWIDVMLGALVGMLGWGILGFNHTLNPHHIDWFFYFVDKEPYYDPVTYFLGWNYFRHSPWRLPLGLNHSYGMEFGSSIVYSDSTPLLAVLLKPFSPLMGPVFQYCGLWILSCFVLQGVLAIKLASVFVRNYLSKIVITAFFVLSPVLLERGWTEYAHMGQWVLLWAIYLNLRGGGDRNVRWVWMVLVVLAVGTSFYYTPMVLALWLADALRRWLAGRRLLGRLAMEGGGMLVSLLFTMWILGYFAVSVSNAATDDFGKCGVNLLGPIDPWSSSLLLRNQPRSPFWIAEELLLSGCWNDSAGGDSVFRFDSCADSPATVISNCAACGGHVGAGSVFAVEQNRVWKSCVDRAEHLGPVGIHFSCVGSNDLAGILRSLAGDFLPGGSASHAVEGGGDSVGDATGAGGGFISELCGNASEIFDAPQLANAINRSILGSGDEDLPPDFRGADGHSACVCSTGVAGFK